MKAVIALLLAPAALGLAPTRVTPQMSLKTETSAALGKAAGLLDANGNGIDLYALQRGELGGAPRPRA